MMCSCLSQGEAGPALTSHLSRAQHAQQGHARGERAGNVCGLTQLGVPGQVEAQGASTQREAC